MERKTSTRTSQPAEMILSVYQSYNLLWARMFASRVNEILVHAKSWSFVEGGAIKPRNSEILMKRGAKFGVGVCTGRASNLETILLREARIRTALRWKMTEQAHCTPDNKRSLLRCEQRGAFLPQH